ncbi:MAG: hypothetical protein [Caudoviricetes sp.]|nr:MAG: hypothetical protein [Caudoviricetes sp.]
MTTNKTIDGVPRGRDALVVLIESFRDALHRGKQPTFSAGDLKFFITEFCELRALLDAPIEETLLEAFSRHARQFTFKNHPALPAMFPKGYPWFKAGYEAGKAAQPQGATSEVVSFGIQVEKLLCEALGREWAATGISIESLVSELKVRAGAGAQPQGEQVAWKYCPECGSEEIYHQEGEHKQCAECHQEWFSDVDYTGVVRGHLKKLKAAQLEQVAVAQTCCGSCPGGCVIQAATK